MPLPRPAAWSAALALVGALALHACSGGNGGGTAPVTPPGGGGTTPVGPAPVASVTVTPGSCALVPGGSCTLTAATLDAAGVALSGRPVTWSAATPAVATVSAAGVVTAVAVGSTVITASAEGRSATATVTVTPVPVASVTLTPTSAALRVGGRQPFTATARDAGGTPLAGRPVTWSSSAAAVAVVDTAGTVSAVAPGAATITATIEGRTATAAVTVTAIPVATVSVAPATPVVRVGASLPMTASARDSAGGVLTGRPVTWQSSTPAVASITAAGVVTGVAPGTATITATVEGRTATAVVTVERVPVATVSITPASVTLVVDIMAQLAIVARDSAGAALADRPAAWSSSAPAVAQVNASGMLRGIAPGTATITAMVEGRTATATVRVSALLTLRMYYSAALTGPWEFKTVAIRGGDALEVVDPSPVLMPDGRILLYYLMNYQRGGDPGASQPGNQWKMGVAESTDHGESFTERGTAFTSPVAITDPFPMVLADGRIRMLYAQTVAGSSQVFSATSADSTGLTFPYAADPGTRSVGASIPGALRIGGTYFLYACAEGITYATSTDGLTFGARAVALPPSSGIICDPSPISLSPTSHVMAFKTRTPGATNPSADSTYLATSTNGTTWNRLPAPVGPGSVPGLVRDRNGLYRIYVVYFPPR